MPRRTRYGRITAWLGLVLTLLLAGCGERQAAPVQADSAAATTENVIAAYLRDAEIQAETDGQRRTLREALEDLIEKPDAELLAARYAGPDGPTQRDVAQVLRAHIAPARPIGLDIDALLAARGHAEARSALREKIDELDRSLVEAASAPK